MFIPTPLNEVLLTSTFITQGKMNLLLSLKELKVYKVKLITSGSVSSLEVNVIAAFKHVPLV